MKDINCAFFTGRVVKDAELKYLQGSDNCYTQISIACNGAKKDARTGKWEDEANFFDVVIWGKYAKELAPYLLKGKPLTIVGRLKQDRWQDTDGKTRSAVKIIATDVILGGGGKDAKERAKESASRAIDRAPDAGVDSFADDIPF